MASTPQRAVRQLACLGLAILALLVIANAAEDEQAASPDSDLEKLYQEGMAIRYGVKGYESAELCSTHSRLGASRHPRACVPFQRRAKRDPSWQEMVQCVQKKLVVAAGVIGDDPDFQLPAKAPADSSEQDYRNPVPNFPKLFFGPREHKGALRELAKCLMEGWGCDPDAQLALELFKRAAQLGDPEAQREMAVRYSYGLQYHTSWEMDGIVHFGEPDPDEAMLHYYYASTGGEPLARTVLGYQHLYGLSVPKSCLTSAMYYLPVAEQVSDLASNPFGPGLPQIERIRLNMHYLYGAKAERQKEVVQYYQNSADMGNVDAQTAVGQVLNYGTHGVERDHQAAMSYLQRASDAGDVQATAHLANMYANGVGSEAPDFTMAFKLFEIAARQRNPAGLYGLAYMYLVGQGVAQDYDEAFKLFTQAADQGHADAHFFLGVMHMKGLGSRHKSVQRAFQYFTAAAHAGNVQAAYNAALLHLGGKGTVKNCKPAVTLLKTTAERGPVGAMLQRGHEAFFKGWYQVALWEYLQAAAGGMELGMANAAWLLDQGYVRAGGEVRNVTFQLFQRSAAQGNIASLLAMGDAYFYGRGVHQDWQKASAIYYEAYQERSPEAMFNLGFVHEFGAGVPKDLTLARRFYDMALHTNSEAVLAVYCARTWLALHRAWDLIRPYLPARFDHVWAHFFALSPPHTSVLGSWTALAQGLVPSQAVLQFELNVWQVFDAAGLTSVTAYLADKRDVGETVVMFGLMGLLLIVLRLRRQRLALHVGGAVRGGAVVVLPADLADLPPELARLMEGREGLRQDENGLGLHAGEAQGSGGRRDSQQGAGRQEGAFGSPLSGQAAGAGSIGGARQGADGEGDSGGGGSSSMNGQAAQDRGVDGR